MTTTAAVIDLSQRLNASLSTPEAAPVQPEMQLLEPGIYPDVAMADYHALPYLSASGLEKLRRSPLQYLHSLGEKSEPSPALERGTAVHLAVLEPALFDGHYVVIGQCEGVKRDKERCGYQGSVRRNGQDWCKTHAPNAADDDVETLSQADFDAVIGMRDAILGHHRAATLFQGNGAFELTVIFDDPDTGIRCKIRPDRLIRRAGMLVDLKTTRDASAWAFPRQAESLGYFRKLALYRRGLRAHDWPYKTSAVLAIESEAPFDLVPYLTDESDLDNADKEITRLMQSLKQCRDSNVWPGYADEFSILQRPAWVKEEN